MRLRREIEELKEKNIIINCAIDKVFDVNPKTKLNDVKFTFQPHPFFVEEIKKAKWSLCKLKFFDNNSLDFQFRQRRQKPEDFCHPFGDET